MFKVNNSTQQEYSLQRFEVEKITGHQSVRGRGGVIAVMYETLWTGLSGPSWEREIDLQLFRREILRYRAGIPDHRQTNRLYRRMRIGDAQGELCWNNGERFLAPGYGCVPRAERLSRYSITVLPNGAHVWYKRDGGLWWLGKISASTTTYRVYLVRYFWTTRTRSSFLLLRRATRLRLGRYEVLGVSKCP